MIWVGMGILLVAALGLLPLIYWTARTIKGAEVVHLEPISEGDVFKCSQCGSWWFYTDEEIHYAGCTASLIRRSLDGRH